LADIPITVCRPGAPAMARPAPERLEGPYGLIVGRMSARERYKGHDSLIEAWPLVRRAIPDARLVIAGDGDDASGLREQAATASSSFVGPVDAARRAAVARHGASCLLPRPAARRCRQHLEATRPS